MLMRLFVQVDKEVAGYSAGKLKFRAGLFANAAYRLEEHGWTEDEIERAVAELLRFVGLEEEEELKAIQDLTSPGRNDK